MTKTIFATVTAALMTLGLAACDVDKTQEGNLSMPKYQAEKTKEGDVTLPKYDVKTPDVAVGKEEKTVEVPKVTTEEKKVDVPTVDVKPAEEKETQK